MDNISQPGAVVADRIAGVAAALGVPTPAGALGALIRAAFDRPLTDPAYRHNALCPGGWPIEVSFAETEPDALRLDLAPLDPTASGLARQVAAATAAGLNPTDLVPWQAHLRPERFGGFVGASVAPGGRAAVKAYLELDSEAALAQLPGPLGAAAVALGRHVPGLAPHLIALDPGGVDRARLYLAATSGLRLLGLLGWAAEQGLAERVPALIDTVRRLSGGRLVLPDNSVLVAVRVVGRCVELKVELTSDALGGDVADLADHIGQLLVDRPASWSAFQRWRVAVEPLDDITVVSVRIGGDRPGPLLNVYASLLGPRAGLVGAR